MSEFGGERLSAVPVCQWRLIKEKVAFVYMTVCLRASCSLDARGAVPEIYVHTWVVTICQLKFPP